MFKGYVALVGAGPGHPGLMTCQGEELLARADAVLYDYLVPPQLLLSTKFGCELVSVGKAGGKPSWKQSSINERLIAIARQGKFVVRLKGGDPFLMGRGGEEAQALTEAGVPFIVVPGVSSSYAVPAFAGIPVTDRRFSSGVTVSSGHPAPDEDARRKKTQVVLMTLAGLKQVVASLQEAGYSARTPACLISRGTTPFQREITGDLASIADLAQSADLPTPAMLIVGSVVKLHTDLNWRKHLPLSGKRILTTRPKEKNTPEMLRKLELFGAEVVQLPTVAIHPAEPHHVDGMLEELADFDWLVFTSALGVETLFDAMMRTERDWRCFDHVKIAVIGEKTGRALRQRGRNPEFTAKDSHGAGLLKVLLLRIQMKERVALCQARQAHPALKQGLSEAGICYREFILYDVNAPVYPPELIRDIFNVPFDLAIFGSPLSVVNLKKIQEQAGLFWNPACQVACIGPETRDELRKHCYEPWIVADKPDFERLIQQVLTEWGVNECILKRDYDGCEKTKA